MKPKYKFIDNAKFALQGIRAMIKHEKSFRIEVAIILPLALFSLFLPLSVERHIFLVASLLLIFVAEAFNSAVEAAVDLVTLEFDERAKMAKDCASAGVFFTIILAVFIWGYILVSEFISL